MKPILLRGKCSVHRLIERVKRYILIHVLMLILRMGYFILHFLAWRLRQHRRGTNGKRTLLLMPLFLADLR